MPEFKVVPQASSKVTGWDLRISANGLSLPAILKVTRNGYVPENVMVRRRIDETMFTADVPTSALPQLENDDGVASVAVSEPLNLIE